MPDTIEINLKEIEYEKSGSIVKDNIIKVLKDNGYEIEKSDESDIELKGGNRIQYSGGMPSSPREAYITVNSSMNGNKIIKLNYSDSKNYNSADEQYVKKLKFTTHKYYEIDLDEALKLTNNQYYDQFYNKGLNEVESYYKNQINDNSIEIKADSRSGEGGMTWLWMDLTLGIYKNGIFYNSVPIKGGIYLISKTTVPSDMNDNEIPNYLKNKLQNCFNNNGIKISSIEKLKSDNANDVYEYEKEVLEFGIDNIYTIKPLSSSSDDLVNFVIVNKEKKSVTEISKTDSKTNVKLEANTNVVPTNTVLETSEIKEEKTLNTIKESLKEISNKYVSYNITLKSNGVAIQPNGNVKISIPIPNDFNKNNLVVYRIENDGTKTKYDVSVNGNYATFETNHFSTYVLAEKDDATETNITNKTSTNKGEKDSTPKTGNIDIISYVLLIAGISVIGIIALKKKVK